MFSLLPLTKTSLALALGLVVSACSSSSSKADDTTDTTVDCSTETPAAFASLKGFDSCTTCHSSTLTGAARSSAPVGIDFDTYELAKANAREAVSELDEGAMPPAGNPQPTDAQKEAIAVWAACGTPK
jgi:uncharacterized membrane protein